ncbi:hypothetical protein Kfla_3287 [Kribbella flavida DSM 17836]|uniref:Uncharacterized protein n=1 Tax=Kribbella flavida (strain DSM 17836 / JCM 10339 / NBRC 14399) TaxID=479435 RepID=D2Q4N4_KRIFD|nr:hypothetical protein [Kribbella flavida]ADB32348.1 hypothetical protein Kfla_3287 [Kribbella flavida DSM 17836]
MSDHDPKYAIARTGDETLLFLELHPCPDCGSIETPWEHGLADDDGELVISYAGVCSQCGAERQYLFGLPERESVGPFPHFGGPEASELLDAGQWLAVADSAAESVPADAPADDSHAATVMSIARAAVEEVLKFVPPGADAVPDDAFWTDDGRAVRDAEPGRFRVERLLVVRDSYSDPGAN